MQAKTIDAPYACNNNESIYLPAIPVNKCTQAMNDPAKVVAPFFPMTMNLLKPYG